MMNYILENNEPVLQVEFKCAKNKQRLWIDTLLKYSNIDIPNMAGMLNVSPELLHDVYAGKSFLDNDKSGELGQLVLFLFSD